MKPEITEALVGHFVRVRYNDVGCVDALCIGVTLSDYPRCSVYCDGEVDNWVHDDQLVSIGPNMEVPEF
jgi:hypothetical protein